MKSTRSLSLPYSLRRVKAAHPEVEDDEIEILLHGVPTRWSIQLSGHDFILNEYEFDAEGDIDGAVDHGEYRTLPAALVALCLLIKEEK
jgi:hypothetical protein